MAQGFVVRDATEWGHDQGYVHLKGALTKLLQKKEHYAYYIIIRCNTTNNVA